VNAPVLQPLPAQVPSGKLICGKKFLLRIGWGEGGRRPDEVNREPREIREHKLMPLSKISRLG
jgi:hypothetical protein